VLVAIVLSDGTSPQAFSVTDASGLTWTQQGTYSTAYIGSSAVFTATVPGAPPIGMAPAVTATAPVCAATLKGTVNPEGAATTYQFQYGTTTSYGTIVPATPGSAGSGSTAQTETYTVSGLQPSTTYHYELGASNATGTTFSTDQSFTTAADCTAS
jgi:hypothetical protein